MDVKDLVQNIEKHINKPYRYYASARILFISGAMDIAAINFGYALDLMLKWCCQLKNEKLDYKKHNLNTFFDACVKNDVFSSDISRDFIDYVDSLFNSRYPREVDRIVERETEQKFRFWGITTDFIHKYDDLIIKIDNELMRLCGNRKCSIYEYAKDELATVLNQSFWHCNYPAFSKFKKEHEDTFQSFLEDYWVCIGLPFYIPYNEEKLNKDFANEQSRPLYSPDTFAWLIMYNNSHPGVKCGQKSLLTRV